MYRAANGLDYVSVLAHDFDNYHVERAGKQGEKSSQ
jgi:hypothetical protein